jgi:hypothetical protein
MTDGLTWSQNVAFLFVLRKERLKYDEPATLAVLPYARWGLPCPSASVYVSGSSKYRREVVESLIQNRGSNSEAANCVLMVENPMPFVAQNLQLIQPYRI